MYAGHWDTLFRKIQRHWMKDRAKSLRGILFLAAGLLVIVMLLLYTGGVFRSDPIRPDIIAAEKNGDSPAESVGRASVEYWPEWYEAVGTVRSEAEAQISAQITGRVVDVAVRPGDRVEKGVLLLQLDDREFKARLDQALQGLRAANAAIQQAKQALIGTRATFVEAQSHYKRIKGFFQQEAATKRDLEKAEAVFHQAQAAVNQAKEKMIAAEAGAGQAEKRVEEARVALGYTTITAPEAGQIAKRLVDPGDLAQPGKPLLIFQAPDELRLEAHVREGLIKKVLPGSRLRVHIDAIDAALDGTVEEVIPLADPLTRTFLAKVRIPAVAGLYPGMFGRLRIPLEARKTVVVPASAVQQIGQMTVVKVRRQDRWSRRLVKTGNALNGKLAVLSGLDGNEEIALHTGKHE